MCQFRVLGVVIGHTHSATRAGAKGCGAPKVSRNFSGLSGSVRTEGVGAGAGAVLRHTPAQVSAAAGMGGEGS